jgi:hypothetical protein
MLPSLKKVLLTTCTRRNGQPEKKREEDDVYGEIDSSLRSHGTTLEAVVDTPKGARMWPGVATGLRLIENAKVLFPRIGKHDKKVLIAHLLKDVSVDQAARVSVREATLHHARAEQNNYDHDLFHTHYTPQTSRTHLEDIEVTATIELAVTYFFQRRSSGPEDSCLRVDTKGRVYWEFYRGEFHDGKVCLKKMTHH